MIFLTNLERVEAEKLPGVTIGDPTATIKKTIVELQADDIVGVYTEEEIRPQSSNTKYLGVENPRA